MTRYVLTTRYEGRDDELLIFSSTPDELREQIAEFETRLLHETNASSATLHLERQTTYTPLWKWSRGSGGSSRLRMEYRREWGADWSYSAWGEAHEFSLLDMRQALKRWSVSDIDRRIVRVFDGKVMDQVINIKLPEPEDVTETYDPDYDDDSPYRFAIMSTDPFTGNLSITEYDSHSLAEERLRRRMEVDANAHTNLKLIRFEEIGE